MLEEKEYTKAEIESILNVNSREKVKRKLDTYDVKYQIEGRGDYKIRIISINDPFKLFCILELSFPAQTDFVKLRNFIYFFLNYEDFMSLPNEKMQLFLVSKGKPISRQTIGKWQNHLINLTVINESSDYNYYFSYKGTLTTTDHNTYLKAWHMYFYQVDTLNYTSSESMSHVIAQYGGVPRKKAILSINAFYLEFCETLNELATKSFEANN